MRVLSISVLGALALAASTPASALTILDQTSMPTTGSVRLQGVQRVFFDTAVAYSQGIRMGQTGLLSRISLLALNANSGPADGTIRLFRGGSTWFQNTPLFTQTISIPVRTGLPNTVIDWTNIPSWDVSSARVMVNAGEDYVLTFSSSNSNVGYLLTYNADGRGFQFTYANGVRMVQLTQGGSWRGLTGNSAIPFSTFVTVVPEPSTWATLLSGFALLGGGLRYSRTRAALI